MKILLNLLNNTNRVGGMKQYSDAVTSSLLQDTRSSIEYIGCYKDIVQSANSWIMHHPIARYVYETACMKNIARNRNADIVYWFGNLLPISFSMPSILTVADLLWNSDPGAYSRIQLSLYRNTFRSGLRRSTVVAAISEFTKRNIIEYEPSVEHKIHVMPYPVPDIYHVYDRSTVDQYSRSVGLNTPCFLYVSNFYPHKNHEMLLRAYSNYVSCVDHPWHLYLRGGNNGLPLIMTKFCDDLSISDFVHWVPAMPLDEMPLLYNAVECVLFPSRYEGLGMGLVEALSCGKPVIASDIPPFREYGGNACVFVDFKDVSGWTQAMVDIHGNAQHREEIVSNGFNIRDRYRKEDCIERFNTILDSIHVN